MSAEIKMIAIGVTVILLALGGYFGYRLAYDSGQTAGRQKYRRNGMRIAPKSKPLPMRL